jgi:hypothetical protein
MYHAVIQWFSMQYTELQYLFYYLKGTTERWVFHNFDQPQQTSQGMVWSMVGNYGMV